MNPSIEEHPAPPRWRPWFAVLLSLLLVSGLGQCYAGRTARGVAVFAVVVVASALGALLIVALPSAGALVAMVLVVAVGLGAVVDAFLVTRSSPLQPWTWGRRGRLVLLGIVGVVIAEAVRTSIRSHIAEPFHVPSAGMEPTLRVGDYFMLDRRAYRERDPSVGDVVVFLPRPEDPEDKFVQRIRAGPGDRLSTAGEPPKLEINGVPTGLDPGTWAYPFTLGAGQFFVVGDNADRSFDSRRFGPVAREAILGRARFIHFSRVPETCEVRFRRIGRRLDHGEVQLRAARASGRPDGGKVLSARRVEGPGS